MFGYVVAYEPLLQSINVLTNYNEPSLFDRLTGRLSPTWSGSPSATRRASGYISSGIALSSAFLYT